MPEEMDSGMKIYATVDDLRHCGATDDANYDVTDYFVSTDKLLCTDDDQKVLADNFVGSTQSPLLAERPLSSADADNVFPSLTRFRRSLRRVATSVGRRISRKKSRIERMESAPKTTKAPSAFSRIPAKRCRFKRAPTKRWTTKGTEASISARPLINASSSSAFASSVFASSVFAVDISTSPSASSFICPDCETPFQLKSDFDAHVASHKLLSVVRRGDMQRVGETSSELEMILSEISAIRVADDDDGFGFCFFCGVEFSSEAAFKLHALRGCGFENSVKLSGISWDEDSEAHALASRLASTRLYEAVEGRKEEEEDGMRKENEDAKIESSNPAASLQDDTQPCPRLRLPSLPFHIRRLQRFTRPSLSKAPHPKLILRPSCLPRLSTTPLPRFRLRSASAASFKEGSFLRPSIWKT